MLFIKLFMVVVFTVSCGGFQTDENKKLGPDGQPYDDSSAAALSEMKPLSVEVSGYVSPIKISVDGKPYDDGEDFYTQELGRLETLVTKEYPDYTFSFEADVGLRDLKQGLSVFMVSDNDGYADETSVDGKGRFSFYVPTEFSKDNYLIRAYKRIGLRLTPSDETEKEIYWCYNMYAERSKTLDKAVVLRDFTTKITRYKCSTSTDKSGIQIPTNTKVKAKDPVQKEVVQQDEKGEEDTVVQDTATTVEDDISEVLVNP